MATVPPPDPQPDTGPIETPQPTTPPVELPPNPDDVDNPSAKDVRSNA
jgi:hypothetical protein